jgi:hypothetical protein
MQPENLTFARCANIAGTLFDQISVTKPIQMVNYTCVPANNFPPFPITGSTEMCYCRQHIYIYWFLPLETLCANLKLYAILAFKYLWKFVNVVG